MDDWDREAEAQAQLLGWLIFGSFKLAAWCVRVVWRLLTRHAWVLLLVFVAAVQWRWLPPPVSDEVVHAVGFFLVVWTAITIGAPPAQRVLRARRARRVAAVAARQLERPEVQAWATSRLPDGRVRNTARQGLAVWGRWRGVRRTLRRDLRQVHAGHVPRRVVRQWETSLRAHVETNA